MIEESTNKSFTLQAGGHQDGIKFYDQRDNSRLIKSTVEREAFFYESFGPRLDKSLISVRDQLSTEEEEECLSSWRPKYFGRLDQTQENSNEDSSKPKVSIILENIAFQADQKHLNSLGFTNPNVIDIKLGKILYDQDSSKEKVERMIKASKATTSFKFGIRLTGGKIFDNLKQSYISIDKAFGKSIDPDGIGLKKAFNSFFPVQRPSALLQNDKSDEDGDAYSSEGDDNLVFSEGGLPAEVLKDLIEFHLIPNLTQLLGIVNKLNWKVFGSSVLIVFEGDLEVLKDGLDKHKKIFKEKVPGKNDDYEEEDKRVLKELKDRICLVKMIDFAHAWPSDDVDEGLIDGLRNLLKLFNQLLQSIEQLRKNKI